MVVFDLATQKWNSIYIISARPKGFVIEMTAVGKDRRNEQHKGIKIQQ